MKKRSTSATPLLRPQQSRKSATPQPRAQQSRKKVGAFLLDLDTVTSERMGRVRQKGTRAELIVRKVAHRLGLRYRVENRDLPGSPDVANRRHRWVVFVHGCYWHRHAGCHRTTTPTRNREFWEDKFRANVARDARVQQMLRDRGYRVLVVWECEPEETIEAKMTPLVRTRERDEE